jgi:hypothetical protein
MKCGVTSILAIAIQIQPHQFDLGMSKPTTRTALVVGTRHAGPQVMKLRLLVAKLLDSARIPWAIRIWEIRGVVAIRPHGQWIPEWHALQHLSASPVKKSLLSMGIA